MEGGLTEEDRRKEIELAKKTNREAQQQLDDVSAMLAQEARTNPNPNPNPNPMAWRGTNLHLPVDTTGPYGQGPLTRSQMNDENQRRTRRRLARNQEEIDRLSEEQERMRRQQTMDDLATQFQPLYAAAQGVATNIGIQGERQGQRVAGAANIFGYAAEHIASSAMRILHDLIRRFGAEVAYRMILAVPMIDRTQRYAGNTWGEYAEEWRRYIHPDQDAGGRRRSSRRRSSERARRRAARVRAQRRSARPRRRGRAHAARRTTISSAAARAPHATPRSHVSRATPRLGFAM